MIFRFTPHRYSQHLKTFMLALTRIARIHSTQTFPCVRDRKQKCDIGDGINQKLLIKTRIIKKKILFQDDERFAFACIKNYYQNVPLLYIVHCKNMRRISTHQKLKQKRKNWIQRKKYMYWQPAKTIYFKLCI